MAFFFFFDENGEPVVKTDDTSVKTVRNKGNSIINFPNEYVVLDLETTGRSPKYDKIIEIGALKYCDNKVVDSFSTLINPQFEIDEYITELTGISNEMVKDAPLIEDKIDELIEFAGNSVIIGYNINFDINFIYDNYLYLRNKEFNNDYIDVLRIAKKVLPNLQNHKQITVANFFGINTDESHRSSKDCEICNECFRKLKEEIQKNSSLDDFCNSFKRHYKNHDKLSAKDIVGDEASFKESHPLYGKVCVFTGTLEKMQRKEAMQIVADLGGIPADGINKKTNYLILGNNDYCSSIKDGKSNKQKKAEELILKGSDLEIISEQVFYDLIFEI